jgi:hypothetical protein
MKSILGLLLAVLCMSDCGPKGNCEDMNPDERYFVITPVAGLGNRLRAMASSKILAEASNRLLVVDWIIEPKEMPALFNQLFENTFRSPKQTNLPKACTIEHIRDPKSKDANVMRVKSNFNGSFVDQLVPMPELRIPIIWTEPWLEFRPKESVLSSADYDKKFRQFMLDLIPVVGIRNAVEKFRKENNLENKKVVGVHFRAWNMEHEVVEKDLSPYDKFVEAMKEELVKDKEAVFYLATDDLAIAERFKKDFPNKIAHRTDVVDRLSVAGMRSGVVDWILLGMCELIIGTYESSFSDTAAFRTKTKTKISLGPGMKHTVTW